MKIIDTVVLIASLSPKHPLYMNALKHLQSVILLEDVYVPSVVLLEF
jgi:predicted nucleic acid-binding protein